MWCLLDQLVRLHDFGLFRPQKRTLTGRTGFHVIQVPLTPDFEESGNLSGIPSGSELDETGRFQVHVDLTATAEAIAIGQWAFDTADGQCQSFPITVPFLEFDLAEHVGRCIFAGSGSIAHDFAGVDDFVERFHRLSLLVELC